VAAALHQFRDLKRTLGPRRTLAKARRRLEPFAPVALGLDMEDLLRAVRIWQDWLEAPQGDVPALPVIRVVEPEAVA
jgi:hypothetical protein